MKNFKFILISLLTLVISCSKNDTLTYNLEDNIAEKSEALPPELTDPNYEGTICTFQRNSTLEINTPVVYEYLTNLTDTTIYWEVISGDVEIISGENTNILTVKLGDDFDDASIKATGISKGNGAFDDLECSSAIHISKN